MKLKFYTVCALTNKVTKVADSLEQFLSGVNDETIDTENNWVASERNLDEMLLRDRQGGAHINCD